MNKKKRIMHIDMDAFFASIEQRDQPILKGKPVIVGGELGGRGVVSTCSYEARKYGVKSAMPIALAVRKCPKGIFIKPNGKKYIYASMKVIETLYRYSSKVEPISIDEAYLDITWNVKGTDGELEIGKSLKREIKKEQFAQIMQNIVCNKPFHVISDEAPQAYKNITEVINTLVEAGLTKKIAELTKY